MSGATVALAAWVGVLGLAVGSFLNVVIWRVPRGESVVRPGSHCPGCDRAIAAYDNVPVLSWLALRGRCRHCGGRISARYPTVELLTGALFALTAWRFADPAMLPALPAFLWLVAVSVGLAFIDLDVHRLPNALTFPTYAVGAGFVIAAALGGVTGWTDVWRAFVGMVVLYVFYLALALIRPGGMGFGDVKLAGALGVYLGWLGWAELAVGAVLGFVIGGVVGVVLMATGRASRRSAIPYGPWMLTGAAVAVFAGQPLAQLYLGAAFA